MNDARRPFEILAFVAALLGALALAGSWMALPPALTIEFYLLLVAAVVSENYAVMMPGYSFSIVYPLTMATVVLCGPTPALLVAALTSTGLGEFRERNWPLVGYNFGQLTLSTFLTGWTYVLLGGRVLVLQGTALSVAELPRMLAPLGAAAVISVIANIALASVGVAVKSSQPLLPVLESVSRVLWGQLALGIAGFVIAQVMALEVWAFALFVFPLLIARQFYQSFTAMQDAYTDTIRSLVGALEAKDPYTRGHSERVAEYSVLLARSAGRDGGFVSRLENAALLHDLGKLALPGALLRKTQKLDDDDWATIRSHPEIGGRMVARIPAVSVLAPAVEAHHERLNGTGYPRGLAADSISLEARMLAIADSYDAMTSDRPYRPGLEKEAAVAELRRCSEAELDAGLVETFVGALENAPAAPLRSLRDALEEEPA
ncbi:MAG TPA: HD-GYP domain-containing protein [Coriobacteriia bacterium]|nr:HD-GYP domain-containing protein [Coriobacteriia bacterium]